MNHERPIPSQIVCEGLINPTEYEQQVGQRLSPIVDSAIRTLPICDQLGPENIDMLKTSIINTFIDLNNVCQGRWKSLTVINDYVDTANNHVVVVAVEEPSQVICDLEGICQQEALQGIRNKRRHVKKAVGKTLGMLQTNTTSCQELEGLKTKGNEFFGQLKRPQGW